MKKIQLTRGKYAIVDNKYYKKISQLNWHYHSMGYACYHSRINKKYYMVLMHRLIMNTPQGMDTDHINGNGLDNRQSNLRICTHSQNHMNQRLSSKNTSGFKGVTWKKDSNKWKAYIKIYKKQIHLGHFKNKIDAAKAYNQKAVELFGEFAWLNKI